VPLIKNRYGKGPRPRDADFIGGWRQARGSVSSNIKAMIEGELCPRLYRW